MHNPTYLAHTTSCQHPLSNMRIDYLMFQLTNIYSELYYKFKKQSLNYLTLTISIFMQALSQTNTGDTCTIKWMFGVPEILETMRNMDIKEGSTIQVIQKCRDWLIIGSNNRRLAVGNEVADRIQV